MNLAQRHVTWIMSQAMSGRDELLLVHGVVVERDSAAPASSDRLCRKSMPSRKEHGACVARTSS